MMALAVEHTQPTQVQSLLRHLQRDDSGITSLEALKLYGIGRLAARVYELKQAGYLINEELVEVGEGKRVSRYRLASNGQPRLVWRCNKCNAIVELTGESVASGWGFAYCRKHGKVIARSA